MEFDNYWLVGGYRFPSSLEKEAENQPFPFLGRMEYDPRVMEMNLEGQPLFNLPGDSPAYTSVKRVLRQAGFEV